MLVCLWATVLYVCNIDFLHVLSVFIQSQHIFVWFAFNHTHFRRGRVIVDWILSTVPSRVPDVDRFEGDEQRAALTADTHISQIVDVRYLSNMHDIQASHGIPRLVGL